MRIWYFMYLIDHADWDTGVVWYYTDQQAADEMQVSLSTLRSWRRAVEEAGYITSKQGFQCQHIIIHRWCNPRLKNPHQQNVPGEPGTWLQDFDTHRRGKVDTHPARKPDTLSNDSESITDSAPDGAPGAEEDSSESLDETPDKSELDELFEALAAGSFGITDMTLVGKLGGRIGKLRKWLIANFPRHRAIHVTAFYAWWKSEYGDADAPRDPGKFAEHYLKFVQLKRQGREKPRRAKPAVIDFPDVDPEERRRQAEQLAASKPDVLKEAAGD